MFQTLSKSKTRVQNHVDDSRLLCSCYSRNEEIKYFSDHIFIPRILLHIFRSTLHMHDDHWNIVLSNDSEHPGIESPPRNIIYYIHADIKSLMRSRTMDGIDRYEKLWKLLSNGLQHPR